jgi:hypothetical protein
MFFKLPAIARHSLAIWRYGAWFGCWAERTVQLFVVEPWLDSPEIYFALSLLHRRYRDRRNTAAGQCVWHHKCRLVNIFYQPLLAASFL